MEYIVTPEQLKQVALAQLGTMSQGTTYQQFMQQGRAVASEKGVSHPSLMLAGQYKADQTTHLVATNLDFGEKIAEFTLDVGGAHIVYPIAEFEWNDFLATNSDYLVAEPTIWVVDGDKYTAMI